MKRCTKCGEERSAEDYSPNKSWCKPCSSAYTREYYWKNREKVLERGRAYDRRYHAANRTQHLARMKDYREQIKVIVAEARAEPGMDCGGSFPPVCMEMHHRDPATKRFEVSNAGTPNLARAELAKCDVICANCHRIRHAKPATVLQLVPAEAA
jgi:hypothetical protein